MMIYKYTQHGNYTFEMMLFLLLLMMNPLIYQNSQVIFLCRLVS